MSAEPDKWGEFDNEGWGVFSACGVDDDGTLRIERIDELQRFESDSDVWAHVAARIMAGSKPHADALREVFNDNPTEKEAITEHWGAAMTRLVLEKLENLT